MEPDDEPEEDRSSGLLLPPDDRLWRHPSELAVVGGPQLASTGHSFAGSPARLFEARLWPVVLVSGVVGALIATVAAYTVGGATHRVAVPALERDVDTGPVVTLASAGPATFVSGAARVQPSCVVLIAHDAHGNRVANGVVFRSDGMVLTAAHAVAGAQSLTATVGGTRRATAHIVASDPNSDVAVVKLTGDGYAPAPMGSAIDLDVGDALLTVRPPGGTGNVPGDAASVGAMGQEIVGAGGNHLSDLVRIDTVAPAQTVGAPVVSDDGTVVAITTAIGPAGQSTVWATPVDLARQVAAQLLASGHVVPVWLGVQGGDVPTTDAQAMGVRGGAHVTRVDTGSPAAASGLHAGDVVVGLDGHEVTSMANLIMAVHALAPGTRVELDVVRQNMPERLTAVIAPRPG
ncbi:MAG TPA: trypsin-like peptidase domain-containing protein [Acidimicrobiales bacterium]|nr:trypsin-like peptidase domain-containing protein [Acidimicrobiales bacterium]